MPVVFVHGVRTRPGEAWEKQRRLRRAMFERFALRELVPDPTAIHYAEPMWGDLAAAPRWNHAALPTGSHESFAIEDDADDVAASALVEAGFDASVEAPPNRELLERVRRTAKQNRSAEDRQALEELLDIVLVIAAEDASDADVATLAEFSAQATDYARKVPSPSWLDSVEDDTELINTFVDEVQEWSAPDGGAGTEAPPEYESFGFRDFAAHLGEAARRASGVSGRLAGRAFTAVARGTAHRGAAIFLGDVVVYLNTRGTRDEPGQVVNRVADAIAQGRDAVDAAKDPKLVVVAHSMGGNIVYDILSHFRPDLEVDVFVTVGSQVAFLEELKQFRESDEEVPVNPETDRVPRPPNVKRWINVFDVNDVLGFAGSGVFADVEDYAYSTGEGAIKAHGAYFTLPSFHDRLRERLREGW